MHVNVTDPILVDDLAAWLRLLRCRVQRINARTLDVQFADAVSPGRDDIQLDLFLRVWEVRHHESVRARRASPSGPETCVVEGGLVRFTRSADDAHSSGDG